MAPYAHRSPDVLLVLVLFALVAAGCSSRGVVVPPGWSLAQDEPDRAAASLNGGDGALQVIICHGRFYGTHAGLRVITPNEGDLVWDPAGRFGADSTEWKRRRDLIFDPGPTLEQYVGWRFNGARDVAVAVYEWELPAECAREIRSTLIGHQREPGTPPVFATGAIGLTCCRTICDFLRRFGHGAVDVPQLWFRPESLGDHLWTQSPRRVLIFRPDRDAAVYREHRDEVGSG